jgi:hypothetical protein
VELADELDKVSAAGVEDFVEADALVPGTTTAVEDLVEAAEWVGEVSGADAPMPAAPVDGRADGVTVTVRVSLVVVVFRALVERGGVVEALHLELLYRLVELGTAVEGLNASLLNQLVDLVEDAVDPLDAGT